jgi:hypothetical protein
MGAWNLRVTAGLLGSVVRDVRVTLPVERATRESASLAAKGEPDPSCIVNTRLSTWIDASLSSVLPCTTLRLRGKTFF